MNKTAIKNYAIWARVQLIEAAKQRAYEYEITENGENKSDLYMVGGRLLTKTEKEQRNHLISEINRKGFSQVMEEAAYTWFNRFIALRFMEVNGYLPSKVRIFTDENGTFKPEVLKQAISVDLEGLDRSKVLDLLDKQDNEELYKYLLITQCNALNTGLPYMFEKIANWTELLFPANLLRQDSVIGQMISEIPEEDWTDAVQIIGWLYQYYNSELKDETFALLKKNVKITKERIPAATQLFTPDWIVRYMVENSLGRLWYEGHSDFDKSQWKYYLDEAEQEPEVEEQLKKIRAEYAQIRPEEIKVIDPCMGSGHILVYAFDVLMQIYTSAGWSERDAAKSILENNLYGLDIDDRAGQLAYFAVMMKARKHSRRILNGEVKPNVLAIQDSNWMTDEFIAYVAGKDTDMKADLVLLRKTFKDAKEYGSILNVPVMQYDALYERIDSISRCYADDLFKAQFRAMATEYLIPLVKQSQIMAQKYDVAVTNPPYMSSAGMTDKLSNFTKKTYPNSKSDLYAVFIERCKQFAGKNGLFSMITQHSWMFLPSYAELREDLLKNGLKNLLHLGTRAFEEISGEVVQTSSFVFQKSTPIGYTASFVRLVDYPSQDEKEKQFFNGTNNLLFKPEDFKKMPGNIFAYWASKNTYLAFINYGTVSDYGDARQGMATGDNNRFVRQWYEPSFGSIGFGFSSYDDFHMSGKRYVPYTKSAGLCRWFGNYYSVLKFDEENYELLSHSGNCLPSRQYYFRKNANWSLISTGHFCARYAEEGSVFDVGAHAFYGDRNVLKMLGYFNSVVFEHFIKFLSPTINYNSGIVAKVPALPVPVAVEAIVEENIKLSKADWDSSEVSWDFKKHPLI